NARGGIDKLLVELAAVVADRFDFALELGLVLQGTALLGAQRLELLLALLDAFQFRGRGRADLGRRRARRLGGRRNRPDRQQGGDRDEQGPNSGEGRRLHQAILKTAIHHRNRAGGIVRD